MINIEDFIKNGIEITWTVLDVGYNSHKFKHLINAQDIINYAINKLENGDESLDVVLLASTNATNAEEIGELLKKLTKNENRAYDFEFRKWRVIYVLKYLPKYQDDFVQGLIELGDIWAMFNFPDDSPHIFQGRNNNITPKQYYTQNNFKKLLEIHESWIKKELSVLKSQQQNK